MTENAPEQSGRHAAPDDDPNSDPPPAAGTGGEHAGGEPADGGEGSGDGGADAEDHQPGAGSQTQQPGADPEDEEQIEAERQERLDPDNRPEGAQVDNTDREFDATKGMFTDTDGYEDAPKRYPAIGEAAEAEQDD